MGHQAIKDKLFELHDGELRGEARREVEAHLATCSACRESYEHWQRLARVLFRAPCPPPSEALVDRVMDRIGVATHAHHTRRWTLTVRWLMPALGLATGLLLAIVPGQRTVSIDALLLADGRETAPMQLVLASNTWSVDDVLGLVMEGRQ